MDSDEEPTSTRASKRFRFAGVTEEAEFHEEIPTCSSFREPEKRKTKRKSSHKVISDDAVKKRLKKEEAKRKREQEQIVYWSYNRGKLTSILKEIEPIITYNSIPNPYIMESEMVEEVFERSKTEKLEDWIKRTAEMEKNGGWAIDYIISAEPGRYLGQTNFVDDKKWRALIKWKRFPVPSWDLFTNVSGPAVAEFLLRAIYGDYVEIDIREKFEQNEVNEKEVKFFDKNFAFRYLPYEDRPEECVYIENERALYQGKLRAIEHHCTTANAREGRPPLYIADWTDRPFGDVELRENLVNCANHLKSLLLRGCTAPILFFRFPRRGWTFRALTEFKKNAIIAQSVREIPASEVIPPPKASSSSRNDTAEDSDSNTDEEDDATKNAAQIKKDANSYRKDDDLLYMHHQCDPNTFYETEIMNSDYRDDDKVIQRVALKAARDIKRGEELTYDRYEGKVPRMLYQERVDLDEEFRKGCPCKQANCRFTVELLDKFWRDLGKTKRSKKNVNEELRQIEEESKQDEENKQRRRSDQVEDGGVVANGRNDDVEEEEPAAPSNGLNEEDNDGPRGSAEEEDDDEALLGAEGADDETGARAAANLREKKATRGFAGSDAENDFEFNIDV